MTPTIHLGDRVVSPLLDLFGEIVELQLVVLNDGSVAAITAAIVADFGALTIARSFNPATAILSIFQAKVGDLAGLTISRLSIVGAMLPLTTSCLQRTVDLEVLPHQVQVLAIDVAEGSSIT